MKVNKIICDRCGADISKEFPIHIEISVKKEIEDGKGEFYNPKVFLYKDLCESCSKYINKKIIEFFIKKLGS